MTVNNHLDPDRHNGFIRVMDACDARRQLHVSTAIVAVLIIAVIAVIAMPGLLHGAYNPSPIKFAVHMPQLVHVQQVARVVN